jgi:hypothetical protein
MNTEILYHGANGDSILAILTTKFMLPGAGKIFFAMHKWESSLMHGADTRRKACFVIKVRVDIPPDAVKTRTATPGVADTLIVETRRGLRAEVLELYVRKPVGGGFEIQHFIGAQAITSYLSI